MKKQLLAIIIAAGVSGCAGINGPNGFACASRTLIPCEGWNYTRTQESDAHYAARMGVIGAYLNQQQYQQSPTDVFIQSQRAFRQPRIEVNNYYRRW